MLSKTRYIQKNLFEMGKMNMLKTVKGKIATGAIAVALVGGSGFALANTDAGGKLKSWYDTQFGAKVSTIGGQVISYSNKKFNEAKAAYETEKANKLNEIDAQGQASSNDVTSAINSKKDAYVDQVNTTKGSISANMEAQFDQLTADANTLIDSAGAQGLTWAQNDLGTATGKKGTAELTELQTEITDATNAAKSELQAVINAAKSELNAQLNTETSATTAEIKAAIDAKLVEVQGEIANKATELAAAQKALIVAKAAELQTSGENELANVVNDI